MKGRKERLLILATFIFLLSCSFALAEDITSVTVKALPNYNYSISINVLDPSSYEVISSLSLQNLTDSSGNAYFTFSSATRTITFSLIARQSGRIVLTKRAGEFNNYSTGGTITLELFSPQAPPATIPASPPNNTNNTNITNLTGNAIANLTNDNPSNSSRNASKIFSFAIFSKLKKITEISWKKVLIWIGYIVGAVIVLIILFFLGRKALKFYSARPSFSGNESGENVVIKGKGGGENIVINKKVERDLYEAEKKIKEAQQTIDYIRNRKQKVLDAERKFEEAKKNLEKIKSGY